MTVPTAIIPSSEPEPLTERQVSGEFRALLKRGARIICAGEAKDDPEILLRRGHTPKSKITLFDATIYLTHPRQNPDLRFFVAYFVPSVDSARPTIFPRIFYKDISLIWRSASHLFLEGHEMWIGKGDTRCMSNGRWEWEDSVESTTDLPFEIQSALESLNRTTQPKHSVAVLPLVLRRAPRNRIRAYSDFVRPRQLAAQDRGNRINQGRRIVRFRRAGDPTSLVVTRGFEPDFACGLLEASNHPSSFYRGMISRFRILATNGQIQHLFFLSPQHAWMIPPQALTTELSSYGVRTIDVNVDEDAYIPGYEYHFDEDDDDGISKLHTQIPEGFAGPASPVDATRADASAWLDEIPLLQEFRRFAKSRPRSRFG